MYLRIVLTTSLLFVSPVRGFPVLSQRCPNARVGFQQVLANRAAPLTLRSSKDNENEGFGSKLDSLFSSPMRAVAFSAAMASAGAVLGPFLDSYHSSFGVLQYDNPIETQLWGSVDHPALITSWWVPELFALAGFLIGWLYLVFDVLLGETPTREIAPSVPKILVGISLFTLQYWLSGLMSSVGVDRTTILYVMSIIAAGGFVVLDNTVAGWITSAATAIGGPLIEIGLLTLARNGLMLDSGYHYTDLGETGFFPLWILPVYFLGGPANGNLARGLWSVLTSSVEEENGTRPTFKPPGCKACSDTRCVPCPNCDGVGRYEATGGRFVDCTSCRSRGFVICRECFAQYGEDPSDLAAIRDLMAKMPD